LGRLAAGVVVIWAEEATGGCTTCCCSAEFAGAVRGAVVFSAIAGGPALASAGDAETDTVAAIPSAAATDTTAAVAVAAVVAAAVTAAAVTAAAVVAAAVAAAAVEAAAAAAVEAAAAVSSAAAVSASAAAAAFGWEVEMVPGCREDFLLSSHSALLSLFFSNLLGFAGRLLDRFLLTAVLPAGISLHVKLSCCLPRFVCSTNLAGVRFTRHSQYNESALEAMGPRICVTLLQFCSAGGGEGVVLE
jgi:hypothetical protein